MKKLWMAAAVVLIVLGVPAVASAKPAPLVCGSDGFLDVSGTVKLTSDLTCTLIPTSTSVIALAGHTLTGNIDPGADGTDANGSSFTIKNGTVTGFVIFVRDTALYHVTIRNATVGGPITVETGSLVIHHSHVQDVLVSDASGDSTFAITHNTMANFFAEGTFPGGVTGKIAHNTLSGTILNQSAGPLPDQRIERDNTCGGIPC